LAAGPVQKLSLRAREVSNEMPAASRAKRMKIAHEVWH
jgi:hypothetical protein